MRQRLTLFVYRPKGATVHPATIYDKLHGHSEIRVVKTETGGTEHKTYSYPGVFPKVWHRDLAPGTFVVESKHGSAVADFFKRYRVPYARAKVKEIYRVGKLGRSNGSK